MSSPVKFEAFALQLVLAAGFLSQNDLESIVNTVNTNINLPESHRISVKSVLDEAALVFSALNMELRQVRNDFASGMPYFVLVDNGSSNELLNRILLPQNLAVQFKDLINRMFSDSRLPKLNTSGLNLKDFPARSQLIEFLKANQYVEELTDPDCAGYIYPSIRMLYVLEPYLEDRFLNKSLAACLGCQQWLLKGRLCSNEQCPARLHDRCYEPFFSSRDDVEIGICPLCSSSI